HARWPLYLRRQLFGSGLFNSSRQRNQGHGYRQAFQSARPAGLGAHEPALTGEKSPSPRARGEGGVRGPLRWAESHGDAQNREGAVEGASASTLAQSSKASSSSTL